MSLKQDAADLTELREKAREAIHQGRLPGRRPSRTWGGTGSGGDCAICGVPVDPQEPEIELEFGDDVRHGAGEFRVHVRCLAAWEQELDELLPAPPPPPPPAVGCTASAAAAPFEGTEGAGAGDPLRGLLPLPATRRGGSIAARGRDELTRRRPA